jgi:hypothetical protein
MGRINKLADKIRQWKIGGKKLGSDPIQINNNNIFHKETKRKDSKLESFRGNELIKS